MEKRIQKKVDEYMKHFKESIKEQITGKNIEPELYSNILQLIYDYPSLEITQDDLKKRKRIKNTVPLHERCGALRANLQQCTRRKKNNEKYCGTHSKGRPHGQIDDNHDVVNITKREVWAQDINGIIYYIDMERNVYDHKDIMDGVMNPRVIAKYDKLGGEYSIPNLFNKK
jgi:hypothetical protein